MGAAIGSVLAFAVGVGISPVPIIAVILMLFSTRAAVNGPLFLAGWALGLTVVSTVVYVIANALDVGSSSGADDGVAWLKVALGVALVFAAARKWHRRPAPGQVGEMPGWMANVEHIRPSRAFGLAVLLSANPKNLLLALGASTSLAGLGPTTAEAVVALAAFVAVGSAIVAVAVVYDLAGGDAARRRLDDAKAWLAVHNTAIMAVLFLVFGAVLISNGLTRS